MTPGAVGDRERFYTLDLPSSELKMNLLLSNIFFRSIKEEKAFPKQQVLLSAKPTF